ncbi:hypothetical protein DCS_02259 [Drechmeria coniospora]|uniref:Peroxin 11C n=1 Tax=Drechmeria coniospora TaxID=98403 RepID=A0A151GVJ4_DRECN|nr:hypothetical protein DCS_02259 [Drechmeria coniospora]KYK61118.1 hypothetical protein DCS_02259 [Drechmeria coniospora]
MARQGEGEGEPDPEPEAEYKPLTTLPSGDAIDSSAPPPSHPPTKKQAPLGVVLASVPSKADAFLAHLSRCLQTRAGTDVVLMFLCYACRTGGSVLETFSRPVLQRSARRLVAAAFKLPPATTIVLSSATVPSPLAALALRVGGHLKAASALISETRTFGRLWGLLGLYFAAKKLLLKSSASKASKESTKDSAMTQCASHERFDTIVAYAEILSLISYQAFENLAFLGSKNVLPISPKTADRWSLISVRSWAAYVGLELGRLLVERSRRTSFGLAAEDASWVAGWVVDFTRNLAWAPLTVHWSVPDGLLPDLAVSLLALYPSTGAMLDLWRETKA